MKQNKMENIKLTHACIELKTMDQLDDLLKNKKNLIFIDCYADWCVPCKAFAPTFEKAASTLGETYDQKKYATENVYFCKLDITDWEFESFCEKNEITKIPIVLVLRGTKTIKIKVSEFNESLAKFMECLKKDEHPQLCHINNTSTMTETEKN